MKYPTEFKSILIGPRTGGVYMSELCGVFPVCATIDLWNFEGVVRTTRHQTKDCCERIMNPNSICCCLSSEYVKVKVTPCNDQQRQSLKPLCG